MIRLTILLAAVAGVLSAQQHPDLTIDLLGTPQTWSMAADGTQLRQLTAEGSNSTPTGAR